MDNKRYKPYFDKLYLFIVLPTVAILAAATTIVCIFPDIIAICVILFTDALVIYFLVSPLFGYAELGERSLFIKYGLIMKREIPYEKIREVTKERRFYSEAIMSLKCAMPHLHIKYGSFDVTDISVVGMDELLSELNARIGRCEE
ncbi:MAG: PH domain-containing protein [Clostridia bacterium]|nr:PH domain-containing protein [Clostridia bacterium]